MKMRGRKWISNFGVVFGFCGRNSLDEQEGRFLSLRNEYDEIGWDVSLCCNCLNC